MHPKGAFFSQYIKNFSTLKAHAGIFTKILSRIRQFSVSQKKIRPPIQYQRSFVRIFISAPDPVIKAEIRQSGSCGPLHGEH